VIAAGAALIASIVCCALAMGSSFWRKPRLPGHTSSAGAATLPLEAEYMWFFRDLAKHAVDSKAHLAYVEKGQDLTERDEIRARLSQALAMAPHVQARAQAINAGFGLLAIALIDPVRVHRRRLSCACGTVMRDVALEPQSLLV
jgi:hypothetical protein